MPTLNEEQFAILAREKLRPYWEEALLIFQLFGYRWSFDVALVFLYAHHQKRTEVVLQKLKTQMCGTRQPTILPSVAIEYIREFLELEPAQTLCLLEDRHFYQPAA